MSSYHLNCSEMRHLYAKLLSCIELAVGSRHLINSDKKRAENATESNEK